MSELINNREHRRMVLKELITELHDGKSVEAVKQKFAETFEGVSASEISEAEQALILDGMPVTEVQRLCDVHAAVFKGSIHEIHQPEVTPKAAGYPTDVLKLENRAIEKLISEQIQPNTRDLLAGSSAAKSALEKDLALLWQLDSHYQKKENILFPYLEKHGITAPPKVMWGVDDEVRQLIKDSQALLKAGDSGDFKTKLEEALDKITEMIFKEENILFPMMIETLSPDEWKLIAEDTAESGYSLSGETAARASEEQAVPDHPAKTAAGSLVMPSGVMTLQEIIRVLDTLPFDITFVDRDDTVKYFTQGKERIFARTKSIIGRKVTNCHPPASVHVVEKIVADLKSGIKDHEDFWIRMGEKFVYIRYFAVRSETGEYLGTIEVTQDIAPVQAIDGEKRLMSN